jgi:hypothetical protein
MVLDTPANDGVLGSLARSGRVESKHQALRSGRTLSQASDGPAAPSPLRMHLEYMLPKGSADEEFLSAIKVC